VQFEWSQLVYVLVLAVVNSVIIDHLKRPVAEKLPGVDFWWLPYLALATGGAICAASDLNLFRAIATMPHVLGVGLTAVLAGGGAQLLHEVLKLARDAIRTAVGIVAEDDRVTEDTRYTITRWGSGE
jgi:hypothetical protein